MTTTENPTRTARQLADILRTHDMIAHQDANSNAKFDGWIHYSHLAEYVDITEADIADIVTDCAENMTSPTHKVTDLRPGAFIAERVS